MQQQKSMVSDRKLAHAVGGKSVRACDNCIKNRARWYCAADDAFLCDSCDSSVHSANPLASRHQRVRLKISSSKEKEEKISFSSFSFDDELRVDIPSWQKGFTRKARTPRQKKKKAKLSKFPTHLVPEQEVCSEDEDENENEKEERLLYRVPVFDAEKKYGENSNFTQDMNDSVPSEMDLADFAADVESLLGKGLEDEAFDMEGLGIFEYHRDDVEQQGKECCLRIKDEDEEIVGGNLLQFDDLGRETFELNFDYASPIITCEEEEDAEEDKAKIQENKGLLKLNYDRVMSAWDYRKSPWTTGQRPELNSGDWWPDYSLGTSGIMHAYGDVAMTSNGQAAAAGGGGREAKVTRYREKRRTRLFSKKIRYEVRKLNAEKRPRMKGRFVKRASFAASAFPLLNK